MIPTKPSVAARLGGNGLGIDDLTCTLCGENPETLQHLVLLCPFSRIVWSESPWQMDITVFGADPVAVWVQKVLYPLSVSWHPTRRPALVPALCF